MKLNELEKAVLNRVENHSWAIDPYKDMAKLSEEVGELSREIRRIEDGRERPDEQTPDKEIMIKEIASEIGDVLFPLVKIAHFYGITLEDAFRMHQEKMDKRYN